MNVSNKLRGGSTIRYCLLIVLALATNWLSGWVIPAGIFVILAFAIPLAIRQVAYIWANEVEWVKLGVTEDYATAAQKKMAKQFQFELRESLDTIGQEAYDEVQAAIERREQDRANG
jgi:hypothetical protein